MACPGRHRRVRRWGVVTGLRGVRRLLAGVPSRAGPVWWGGPPRGRGCRRGRRPRGAGAGAVVDVALDGDRGADPLADEALDDHDPLAALVDQAYLVADTEGVGGLDPVAVDPYVAALAGGGSGRTGLDQAYGPDPAVDADGLAVLRPGGLGGGHRCGDLRIDGHGRLRVSAGRAVAVAFGGGALRAGGKAPGRLGLRPRHGGPSPAVRVRSLTHTVISTFSSHAPTIVAAHSRPDGISTGSPLPERLVRPLLARGAAWTPSYG